MSAGAASPPPGTALPAPTPFSEFCTSAWVEVESCLASSLWALKPAVGHLCGSFLLQHLQEQLDLDLSPLEYMMKCYPEIKEKEEMRKIIGRYGLTGKQQVSEGGRKGLGWDTGLETRRSCPTLRTGRGSWPLHTLCQSA